MAEPEDDALRDALEDWFCDLVSLRRREAWLLQVLAGPKGAWHDVDQVARSLALAPPQLPFDEPGALWLSWLDAPEAQPGFCLVLAYDDRTLWSKVALFNRALLLDRCAAELRGPAQPPA